MKTKRKLKRKRHANIALDYLGKIFTKTISKQKCLYSELNYFESNDL